MFGDKPLKDIAVIMKYNDYEDMECRDFCG